MTTPRVHNKPSPTSPPPRAPSGPLAASILRWALLALAGVFVLGYVLIAWQRMTYPFELEWMEGGVVDHVRWILAGRNLYVEPSLQFTPYIYTPLYFYLGAGLSKVLGVGFFPLRLLSFVASLGCFWLIGRLVRRETNSWTWAIVSVGLFAATYRFTGAWMDIARVDSLFLLFALAAIYLLRFRTDGRSMLLAGLLLGLSFLTKQAALFIALPLIVYSLLSLKGWARYAFPGIFLLIVFGSTQLFDALSGGWYRYYIFDLPGEHALLPIMAFGFWWLDIGKNLAVALAMTVFAVALRAGTWSRRDLGFYLLLLAGMLGSSWSGRLHTGGWDNVLLPASAVLAICFSLGATALESLLPPQTAQPAPATPSRGALRIAIYLVAIWQLLILAYWPQHQVPRNRDRRSGQTFVQMLRNVPGEIYMPDHGFLHTLAGRTTFHAHSMALCDVLRGGNEKIIEKLKDQIGQAIRSRQYDVLILDATPEGTTAFMLELADKLGIDVKKVMGPGVLDLFQPDIDANYRFVAKVFDKDNVFWPVTGSATRPDRIYIRNDHPLAPPTTTRP